MKHISIIIPVYNERSNIIPIYESITAHIDRKTYQWSIIFVDDGSTDESIHTILELTQQDDEVEYIQFSRNFGKEIATTAGMHHARGDAVILLDADLQHPPEKIPEFVKKWEHGAQVVVGVRENSAGESIAKTFGSRFFYKVLNTITDTQTVPNSTDFRLIDRKVINEFNKMTEKNRITRGLIDWLGFSRDYVYFTSPPRANGAARYSTLKLIKLALSSFVSQSLVPLKLAGYLGIIITLVSGILGLFIIVEKYFLKDPWGLNFSGPASLAVFIVFLVGIILISLGIIALYIANIHDEVTNRPMYVIKDKNI